MYQVVKRDGNVTDFNISKISVAITKAFEATNKQYNPDTIDFLALKVTADYQSQKINGVLIILGVGGIKGFGNGNADLGDIKISDLAVAFYDLIHNIPSLYVKKLILLHGKGAIMHGALR